MTRRRAAATAALLLVAAACGNGDGSSQATRESAGVTAPPEATTTAGPGAASAAPATTGTTARAGATTSTRRAASGGAPATSPPATAPAGPRSLSPVPPGTYRYDTAGSTSFAGNPVPFPAVTTLVVDAPSGDRQRSTRSLRDAAGNGPATEYTLEYRGDGVYLVSLRVVTAFSGTTDARDLRPASPVLLLGTGARPGAHAEADLTAATPARLVVDVLGAESVTIGGQALDTLVVRAVVTLGPGDVTGRQELTVNVDRGTGLWVRERSIADASVAGGVFTLHSEHTATLQRLTPS